jgi:endonuclease-3
MDEEARRRSLIEILENTYRGAECALEHADAFQLLIATILSAQSTDRQVNKITETLFEKFPGPEDFARLDPSELEEHIRSCGTYLMKAKNIVLTCRALIERHGGKVPETMEELSALPGVGRKTANVVLSNAFGVDAIAVDTHVFRVSNRMGLAAADNVLDTEKQLQRNIPKEKWSAAHHWLIHHGRRICSARNPKCTECPLRAFCAHPVT